MICPARYASDACRYQRGHPGGDAYHESTSGRRWRRSVGLETWLDELRAARMVARMEGLVILAVLLSIAWGLGVMLWISEMAE